MENCNNPSAVAVLRHGHLERRTPSFFIFIVKQESIPVGCVPPASVATTDVSHWGGLYLPGVCNFEGVYVPGGVHSLLGGVPSSGCIFWGCTGSVHGILLPPSRRDMGPSIPPLEGHGTRQTHPLSLIIPDPLLYTGFCNCPLEFSSNSVTGFLFQKVVTTANIMK